MGRWIEGLTAIEQDIALVDGEQIAQRIPIPAPAERCECDHRHDANEPVPKHTASQHKSQQPTICGEYELGVGI